MKNIILIILAMITVSCVKTTVYTEYEKSAPIEIKLDRIKLDSKLSHCDNLFVIDSNLVILNTKNPEAMFELYSMPDVRYIGGVGYKGRGPKDFNFINHNATVKSYDGINVTELNSYCMVGFTNIDGELDVKKCNNTGIPLPSVIPNSLLVINDSIAVMSIRNEEGVEFYMHNRNSNKLIPISYYMEDIVAADLSSDAYASVFLNDLVLNPANECFAAIYSQFPMIRIFDNSGNIKTTSLLDKWHEQSFLTDGTNVKTSSSYQYYLATTANSKYICGLYLGKLPAEMKNISMEDARMEIHVWNWDGELVATYIPDCLVLKIAISDDNTIYAVSPLDDEHIFSFNLGSNH